jgi:hypothetical protein
MATLNAEATIMLSDSHAMRDMASNSSQLVGEMEGLFSGFAQSAQATEGHAARARDMSFASLVKVDHVIYKQRAYMALSSGGDATFMQPISVDHHNCRLGKWYENIGRERFSNSPSYRLLEKPHAQVHDNVHRMVKFLSQGWENDLEIQQNIYQALQATETASFEVMQLIDKMVREKHG